MQKRPLATGAWLWLLAVGFWLEEEWETTEAQIDRILNPRSIDSI